jgi:hypothetical protein
MSGGTTEAESLPLSIPGTSVVTLRGHGLMPAEWTYTRYQRFYATNSGSAHVVATSVLLGADKLVWLDKNKSVPMKKLFLEPLTFSKGELSGTSAHARAFRTTAENALVSALKAGGFEVENFGSVFYFKNNTTPVLSAFDEAVDELADRPTDPVLHVAPDQVRVRGIFGADSDADFRLSVPIGFDARESLIMDSKTVRLRLGLLFLYDQPGKKKAVVKFKIASEPCT